VVQKDKEGFCCASRRLIGHQGALARLEAGRTALALMGAQYNEMLADRTSLLLQLQGFAACGDPEVRDAVRNSFGLTTFVAGLVLVPFSALRPRRSRR
jgi:hypothetical protein